MTTRDQRADADDREAAAPLGALLLLADLVDDRLAVGLDGLLGHGSELPRGRGAGGQARRVYGVAGRNRATSIGPDGERGPAVRVGERASRRASRDRRAVASGATSAPVTRRTAAASSSAVGRRAEADPVGGRGRAAPGRRPRARRTRTGRPPRAGPARRRPGPSSTRREHEVGAGRGRPRTGGRRACPGRARPVPAISSATAGAVTASWLPCASTRPAWSSSTTSPAAPMAMSVWPSRQARPAVSVTTTATLRPVRSATSARSASGRGVRVDGQQHEGADLDVGVVDAGRGHGQAEPGAHDRGRPAPGHDPDRSRRAIAASRSAPGTSRPSALLTTLLVTTTTSPSARSTRGSSRSARSSPGRTSGTPSGRRR